ncbi:hypothetical protein IQ266_07765 [filamentous cyanobacterium LEGE 11480]|uniref:Uncharacterized protein n=1 Tax=Romeriopsis navalis LEGE 11480 TaxID=2777977 RepID=A0A928VP95_9CYAN|nr:hypothetical protein [Romeriopsis navalis]MBE9029624.1 hypothetical protein [Romeriopsis navalis LEGE 11480]
MLTIKVSHLDLQQQRRLIACTKTYSNITVNIATMPLDGARPFDMTEGDSIDLALRWMPGERQLLVYSVSRPGA